MEKVQIEALMKSLKIEKNKLVQVPGLRTIFMSTNQGLDYHENFLYFDTENELLKMKEYKCEGRSALIKNCKLEEPGIIESCFPRRLLNYCQHPYYKFRLPKVGDILFILNGNTIEYHPITKAESYFLEVENLEEIPANSIVGYKSSENGLIQDVKDPKLFLKYTTLSIFQSLGKVPSVQLTPSVE